MPINLTGTNVFTDPVPAPAPFDALDDTTFVPGYQALADRTEWLKQKAARGAIGFFPIAGGISGALSSGGQIITSLPSAIGYGATNTTPLFQNTLAAQAGDVFLIHYTCQVYFQPTNSGACRLELCPTLNAGTMPPTDYRAHVTPTAPSGTPRITVTHTYAMNVGTARAAFTPHYIGIAPYSAAAADFGKSAIVYGPISGYYLHYRP